MVKLFRNVVALAAFASGLHSTNAFATDSRVSGNQCAVEYGSVTFDQFGVRNNSTTGAAAVWCSPSVPGAGTFTSAAMAVYDRHNGADVECTLYGMNADGSIAWSQLKKSQGNDVGAIHLAYNYSGFPSSYYIVAFRCVIPAKTNSGYSHVTSLRVSY